MALHVLAYNLTRVMNIARHDTESLRAPVEERAACIQLSGDFGLRFRVPLFHPQEVLRIFRFGFAE